MSPLDIVVAGMQVEPINVSAEVEVLREGSESTGFGLPLEQGVLLQPGSVEGSPQASWP